MYHYCRHCKTELSEQWQSIGLCFEDSILADDYARFDALREEGHTTYEAKLMAGLADPHDD